MPIVSRFTIGSDANTEVIEAEATANDSNFSHNEFEFEFKDKVIVVEKPVETETTINVKTKANGEDERDIKAPELKDINKHEKEERGIRRESLEPVKTSEGMKTWPPFTY
jgi:hypothetical protein